MADWTTIISVRVGDHFLWSMCCANLDSGDLMSHGSCLLLVPRSPPSPFCYICIQTKEEEEEEALDILKFSGVMGSWVRTITSPFRKAYTILSSPRDKKPQAAGNDHSGLKLHGEVMACTYEDVRVMWSILDKSRSREEGIPSS